MQALSYRWLKGASVSIFLISLFLFAGSQIITFANRPLLVKNDEGKIIGRTWVPHDYVRDQEMFGIFAVLCGLQTWAIFAIGKEKR